MTDAGQESSSAEGGKIVPIRGSWTIPVGMYNDVKEQALETETDVSEKQDSNCNTEVSKESVGVKETSGEALQISEDRGSSVAQDRINEQGTVEESSTKHKRKEPKDHEGERGHRHKGRRRSKSADDRRQHHKSREEPARRKRRRSRESPSRVQSPQHLLECNNDDDALGGKTESSAARDEVSTYASNGKPLDSISQSGFERKPDRKDWEQEHSRKNNLKLHNRERSPYRDSERQYARGDRYEETNHDQAHSKRKRSNSPERGKELTHGNRGSRSDRRRPTHRSRSRSRGRHDRHREASSNQRRGRSRSRSRDYGRNRSKSLSRNNDAELKPKNAERRPLSRSREEAVPVAAGTNSHVDVAKQQSGEEDEWRKKRSRSRSPSKHGYENYGSRDRENRLSQSRDHPRNWLDSECPAGSDYPKRRRSRSRSAERVWTASNWEDRRRFRDEYPRDDLPNSGGWSGRPERVANNKYYRDQREDRRNSWTKGEKDDIALLRNHDDAMPNRWHGGQDDSGNTDRRSWDRDRKRDWDDHRLRRGNHDDQDAAAANDNGQQLEDMVTKSLAKLRRDSDREHRGADEALRDITSSADDKIHDKKGQRWGEADRSAIPVLLSKKSAYKDDSAYDPHEAEDFNFDQACKEDFGRESNSRSLQRRDQQQQQQPGAPSQQRFPTSVKERHVPVGQPRFHGDFREPPPHVRVEFPPRGKALMQSAVAPGQFGVGARLMPGVVQLVTPIHLRPPPMAVDWRMMGPDAAQGRAMFPIARPPPHVGPRGQLIRVGGFIRTQVPVEFLARHPLPLGHHPPGHPFQSGPLPSHSLPPVHPGTPSQPRSIRPHLQSDPRQLPPPPPIALLHSSHRLHLSNQEPPRGLVEMRHLGPPPGLPPPGLLPPHPPPNLAFPPPPLPVKLAGHGQGVSQSRGYATSNQAVETLDATSPSTPPPPPPPAVSSAPQDPRLYSIKLLSHKPVAIATSYTSDESLDSESSSSSLHGQNESTAAAPKPDVKQVRQQQQSSVSLERPSSALSFGSDYTPQELNDDAYADALFEEPYSFEERDVAMVRSEKSESNTRQEISTAAPVRAPGRTNVAEDAELGDVCSQTALEDETAQIPEIVNPMESPTVAERLANDRSPSNAGSADALAAAATAAAHSLQMIEVADLKKVLETVRTTTQSNEEETKNQDKPSNRMDQIAEEVKLALKPHFAKSLINKDEYKDIMRRAVPKIFSSKSTLDRSRIQGFVQEYVNKIARSRKPDKAKKSISQSHGLSKQNSKALSKAV